ncbi:MAG: RNA polymerase factor sigma-54 [Pseudomonadota bacterium]
MVLGIRLEVRQSQQLVMTPQLQQAIKLLQMSNVELCDFVANEVETNPLLTLDDAPGLAAAPEETAPPADSTATDDRVTAEGDLTLAADTFDTGGENLHDDSASDAAPDLAQPGPGDGWSTVAAGGNHGFAEDGADFNATLADRPSLRQHLLDQIGQARADNVTRQIAALIAEDLDEHGFYRVELELLAARLSVSEAAVRPALELVQACDPTGVGARNLAECLSLQLAEQQLLTQPMQALLDHLDLLAKGQIPALCRACCVDRAALSAMLAELRALNPRPASAFHHETAETLIPDVFLRRAPWGGWQIELNSETLPRVLIDNHYAAELESGGEDAREFVSNCRNNANWLIKSLDQRARTILKVTTAIVRHQEAFFQEGITGLRPLTLKMVADEIEMHESTASRVTANKYISTERGIFELKFFFTNSIGPDDSLSAEAVRHRVKALIDAEDPAKILSDDAIVDILQRDGIDIARRTVAKYRKSLQIPSSVDRRRQKALSTV